MSDYLPSLFGQDLDFSFLETWKTVSKCDTFKILLFAKKDKRL